MRALLSTTQPLNQPSTTRISNKPVANVHGDWFALFYCGKRNESILDSLVAATRSRHVSILAPPRFGLRKSNKKQPVSSLDLIQVNNSLALRFQPFDLLCDDGKVVFEVGVVSERGDKWLCIYIVAEQADDVQST